MREKRESNTRRRKSESEREWESEWERERERGKYSERLKSPFSVWLGSKEDVDQENLEINGRIEREREKLQMICYFLEKVLFVLFKAIKMSF